jgi:WD40 repeat protein
VIWPAAATAPLDLGTTGGQIHAVAFVPGSEGRLLVSSGSTPGDGGGITIVWNLQTGGRVATFDQATVGTACACSPDGRLIGSGNWYSGVEVYEAAPEPHVRVLQFGDGQGTVTALSRDGQTLIMTAAPEGETGRDVVIMNLQSGTTTNRFHREGSPIRTLVFAPDGESWFEGEVSGRITQWDLPAGTTCRELTSPGAPFGSSPIQWDATQPGWQRPRTSPQ